MKKIVIVPLSYFLNINPERVLDSLENLGATEEQLTLQWQELRSTCNHYLYGFTKDHDFREKFKSLFPNILNNYNIDAVWNAACQFDEKIEPILNELDELKRKGVTVYVFGEISPMHINYFKEKYRRPIPGAHFFTCERLGRGNELLEELFNYIKIQHSNIYQHDIALFYQPPAPLTLFQRIINWFLSLFNFGRNVAAELTDEQKPYRSVALPRRNQTTLKEVLERELQWDFSSKPKIRQVASAASLQTIVRKKRRKPSDPAYNPSRDPNYDSSDDFGDETEQNYLPLSDSRNEAKRARSHQTSSSQKTGHIMRRRG